MAYTPAPTPDPSLSQATDAEIQKQRLVLAAELAGAGAALGALGAYATRRSWAAGALVGAVTVPALYALYYVAALRVK